MKASSLTSSLLARKGRAHPATLLVPTELEPLATSARTAPRAGSDRAGPAKLTVRLDRDRHSKLKLAALHLNMSAQELMTRALDAHLARVVPEAIQSGCTCLARLETEGCGDFETCATRDGNA